MLTSLPVIINAAFSIASIYSNVYFLYDDRNVYRAGRLVFVLLGICFLLVLHSSVSLILNRRKIASKREYLNLLFFAFLPMTCGFIQVFVRGLDLIWIAATLSILMIFVNINKDQLHTDYLTNLYNRRHLDSYLKSIAVHERNGLIGGIMIDIDDFKKINDLYGHESGDYALKTTARILKRTFRKTDFVARYGGDEFVIVVRIDNRSDMESFVRRLKDNLASHNAQRTTPYEIRLSIGYACYGYDEAVDASMDLFLKRLDVLMYSDKHRHT